MLNLFKSKKSEPSPQDVQNDAFRMQISQLNKALDMYRQTIDNHWAAITKLNKTPAASASYELTVMEKIQKLEAAVKTPPSTSQVRKLFADLSDVVMRVSNLEGKKDKVATENDSKFNAFIKKYQDGIDNHAMHLVELLDRVDQLTKDVQQLKSPVDLKKQEQINTQKTEEQKSKKRETAKKYYSNEEKREAHRAYMVQWNAKRREKREAEDKNSEKRRKQKAYYQANKEKILASLAAAREAKRLKAAR